MSEYMLNVDKDYSPLDNTCKLSQIFYNRKRTEDVITEYWDKNFE